MGMEALAHAASDIELHHKLTIWVVLKMLGNFFGKYHIAAATIKGFQTGTLILGAIQIFGRLLQGSSVCFST